MQQLQSISTLVSLTASFCVFQPLQVTAQIIPDNSLGNESSVVVPNVEINGINSDRIDGGAIRGTNLFHSFQEFNIDNGRGAYFSNPENISNILSRVTGNNLSNILGTLGVLGNANLFLINPNGIVFGPNARLDVGGSFFASTADGILFENGVEFAASHPDAPPLLTINIPIGLNLRDNPARITNQSQVIGSQNFPVGLEVSQGNNITLVGGEIELNNGFLFAPAGKIELGGLSEAGTIALDNNGNLSFPNNLQRANISLVNNSEVGVFADGGGEIRVTADSLEILDGSGLFAGIGMGLSSPESQAGNIVIDATHSVSIDGVGNTGSSSGISNEVRAGGTGRSGNIEIRAGSLSITNSGLISTAIFGQGIAGNVTLELTEAAIFDNNGSINAGIFIGGTGQGGNIDIQAGNLFVTNGSVVGSASFGQGSAGDVTINVADTVLLTEGSGILSGAGFGIDQNGGDVDIQARNLLLNNSSLIGTATFGQGDSGNVTIDVADSISLDGASLIASGVGGIGDGGNVDIQAENLSITNGAQISTAVGETSGIVPPELTTNLPPGFENLLVGIGNAGNVNIEVSENVILDGVGNNSISSQIFSGILAGAIGNGGQVKLQSRNLSLTNGAFVQASTSGQGNAGNVHIGVSDNVILDGVGSNGFSSQIGSGVFFGGIGDGGQVELQSSNLSLTNGAFVQAATAGQGNAGNVTITVDEAIVLDGVGNTEQSINLNIPGQSSGIFSGVNPGGVGDGGTVKIRAGSLTISDGAGISTELQGLPGQAGAQGNAGNVNILVTGDVALDGVGSNGSSSQIGSGVFFGAIGDGGQVELQARNLTLTNGGTIQAGTSGQGNAGNVNIEVSDNVILDGVGSNDFSSQILSGVFVGAVGDGGQVNIQSRNLTLTNGAIVGASTSGQGNAGSVTVEVSDSVTLNGVGSNSFSSGIFNEVQAGGVGDGGTVNLRAGNLFITNGAAISTAVREAFTLAEPNLPPAEGHAGSVNLLVTDNVILDGVGSNGFASQIASGLFFGAIGDGGQVELQARNLILTNGGTIQVSTLGQGDAGTVEVGVSETILIDGFGSNGFSSSIAAQTQSIGNAGSVDITTEELIVQGGGAVGVFTDNAGNAGSIAIVSDSVELSGTAFNGTPSRLSADTVGAGDAGDVSIETGQLTVRDGATVDVLSTASGLPGDINITASETLLDNQGSLNAGSEAGQGGNIRLESNDVRLLNGSEIIATGSESGQTFEGNIEIDADLLVLLQGSQIVTDASSPSGGSNITISPLNDPNIVIVQSNDSVINAAGNLTIDSSVTFKPAEVPEVAVVDPNELIAQEFCRQRGTSQFIVTGRGGIATDPNDKATGNQIEVDLVEPVPSQPRNSSQRRSQAEDNQPISSLDIVPARGWIRDENGDVILVSYDPTKTGVRRQPVQHPQCQP